jgi:hypothetical protein
MQNLIRTQGPTGMQAKELEKFVSMHQEGKLLKPEE